MSNSTFLRAFKIARPDWTVSTPHRPIVRGELECGHYYEVKLKPTVFQCDQCQKITNGYEEKCGCPGIRTSTILEFSQPHDQTKWIIPTELCECLECKREAEDLEKIPEYVAQSVHSRFRDWCGGIITFYGPSPTSPTGVLAIGTVKATKAAFDLISALRSSISPLSPTEGLRR